MQNAPLNDRVKWVIVPREYQQSGTEITTTTLCYLSIESSGTVEIAKSHRSHMFCWYFLRTIAHFTRSYSRAFCIKLVLLLHYFIFITFTSIFMYIPDIPRHWVETLFSKN